MQVGCAFWEQGDDIFIGITSYSTAWDDPNQVWIRDTAVDIYKLEGFSPITALQPIYSIIFR